MSQTPNQALLNNGVNFVPTLHNDTYPFISPLNLNLSGRAVFITGASKGIGRSTALAFARAGASNIIIAARSALSELSSELTAAASAAGHPEPQILTLTLDVSDEDGVAAAASAVTERVGRLDILVNNAGASDPFIPLIESNPKEWWRTYEVNVKGPYLTLHALLPLMGRTVDGLKTVLNVSSIGAHVLSEGSAYQTGKLAILRLTEFVAQEEKEKGFIAISIHPGGVATDLAMNLPEYLRPNLVDKPELAGDSIVWLTGERKEWLSGRYVSCNWDMQELLAKQDEIVKGDLLKVRMAVKIPE
jgi:NAD(P)-dependent dehydrogenase (short-subunit alcohol dehydrogenase family)